MGISDWSSDVCSSDLARKPGGEAASIGDRVASGSSVRDRAFATRVGSGADGARHLKKSGRYLCGDAAMKFAFIEQHASTWPVHVMCRMLGVSRSGYYDWFVRAPSARTTAISDLLHDVRRLQARRQRSEDSRVRNECGSTCRSRW